MVGSDPDKTGKTLKSGARAQADGASNGTSGTSEVVGGSVVMLHSTCVAGGSRTRRKPKMQPNPVEATTPFFGAPRLDSRLLETPANEQLISPDATVPMFGGPPAAAAEPSGQLRSEAPGPSDTFDYRHVPPEQNQSVSLEIVLAKKDELAIRESQALASALPARRSPARVLMWFALGSSALALAGVLLMKQGASEAIDTTQLAAGVVLSEPAASAAASSDTPATYLEFLAAAQSEAPTGGVPSAAEAVDDQDPMPALDAYVEGQNLNPEFLGHPLWEDESAGDLFGDATFGSGFE